MAAVHTTSPASPASSPPTSSSCSTRASRSTDTRISHVRSGTRFGPPTHILHDSERRYCVEGLIDVDAFGRVAIASVLGTSSPVLVAIKVYGKDLTPHLDTMHDNECRIMRENASFHSAWLVWSHGAFGDEWNRYLIMDYYPNSLARTIFNPDYRPPRKVIRLWVEELALAMFELHNEHIVHCDLKPSNILVTWDGRVALADFGTSLTPKSDSCKSPDKPFDQCVFFAYGGTYACQAPELLIKHARASFTCSVDMSTFGVVIYEMYTGKNLFSPEANGVRNEVWGWDDRLKVTDLCWHPYFSETNWATIAKKENVQGCFCPVIAHFFELMDGLKCILDT